MTLAALNIPKIDHLRLEGNPPDRFDGSRDWTMHFLTQFHRFMLMNNDATIAHDPIKKCGYFLSLIEGPKVEGWTERMYKWLDAVHTNPRLLFGNTPWQEMEQEFKDAFTDYAEHERAQDEMKKLKMKEGRIDKYIATFKRLTHRAGVDPNDPSNLRTFAQGLPHPLVEVIIWNDSPENFQQWATSAQRQQCNWMRIQLFKNSYGSPQPQRTDNRQCQSNNSFGNFYWRHPEQAQGYRGFQQNQGQAIPNLHAHVFPLKGRTPWTPPQPCAKPPTTGRRRSIRRWANALSVANRDTLHAFASPKGI